MCLLVSPCLSFCLLACLPVAEQIFMKFDVQEYYLSTSLLMFLWCPSSYFLCAEAALCNVQYMYVLKSMNDDVCSIIDPLHKKENNIT
jgi:hypothetical protein